MGNCPGNIVGICSNDFCKECKECKDRCRSWELGDMEDGCKRACEVDPYSIKNIDDYLNTTLEGREDIRDRAEEESFWNQMFGSSGEQSEQTMDLIKLVGGIAAILGVIFVTFLILRKK